MLRLENVKKQFGAQVVLDDASLAIHPGEKVGLIGPNGAGKTTIFRIVEGVEGVDGGVMNLRGRIRIGVLRQELAASDRTVLAEVLEGESELNRLREEQERLYDRLASAVEDAEQERLSARLGEVDHHLERIGGYDADARAASILMGLGFTSDEVKQPLGEFSGGWRMRAALARLLFSKPDLLLLDEPTNHLDIESVAWLEKFLARYPGTLVVISHDSHFLNRVAGVIVELQGGRLTRYTGNFDSYLEQREAHFELLEKAAAQQERRISELEGFIRRFRAKATKARQAQSRVKQLEKIKPVEKIVRPAAAPIIRLPDPPASSSETLSVEGLGKSYGDNQVFSDVDLKLPRGEKIGLIGPNGAGKTTFLRIVSGEIKPDAGHARPGDRVCVGHFSQFVLDALDTSRSVLESATDVAPSTIKKTEIRSLLGGFLFSGDSVFKKVSVLSGGERARLALARLFMSGANLLLLDEPTNHLDMGARAALEEALELYAGTFILVAHDRDLLEAVCDAYWVVEGGTIRPIEGSLEDYLEGVASRRLGENGKKNGKKKGGVIAETNDENNGGVKDEKKGEGQQESSAPSRKNREGRHQAAEVRNRLHRETQDLRKKSKELEKRIRTLEADEDELKCRLAEPGLYDEKNKARLAELLEQHRKVAAALKTDMDAWEQVMISIEAVTLGAK
jgi:ATP-binding cassette subfamily F protein 3